MMMMMMILAAGIAFELSDYNFHFFTTISGVGEQLEHAVLCCFSS